MQLREAALRQLDTVISGKAELDYVDSFCKVANTILDTLKVEINYLKASQKEDKNKITFIDNNASKYRAFPIIEAQKT
jgi:hypothetical protein